MNTMTCSLIVFRNSVILPLLSHCPVLYAACTLCPCTCTHTQSCTVSLILVAALYNCFLPPVLVPPIPLMASPLGLLLPSQAQAVTHPSKFQSAFKHSVPAAASSSALPWDLQYSTFPSSYQRVEVEVNRIITAECKFAIFRTYTSARKG